MRFGGIFFFGFNLLRSEVVLLAEFISKVCLSALELATQPRDLYTVTATVSHFFSLLSTLPSPYTNIQPPLPTPPAPSRTNHPLPSQADLNPAVTTLSSTNPSSPTYNHPPRSPTSSTHKASNQYYTGATPARQQDSVP